MKNEFEGPYFLVINFLPLTNVVEVDVRLVAPLLTAPLLNDVLNDEIDVKPPFEGSGLKKSSINDTFMNGFMNDVSNVLL